ncbi:hypothetical protein DAMNIGENAA_24050 [Desulforhabdus amnigena]|jgi:hypothetical protein|uniref:Uncharacterized protein n=1 Tax=Desulforhabdus amnigena TaxID=40218 RepID=A0A9W6FU92_9BACT|nr:hypothetical protein DAMNIGENAA_24050 [Desulforhabdus amnigena]
MGFEFGVGRILANGGTDDKEFLIPLFPNGGEAAGLMKIGLDPQITQTR